MRDQSYQDEINKAEWENPDNWSTIYFSKKDSRTCVPKKNPRHGWTVNFATPSGGRWIYYFLILFFLLGVFAGVIICTEVLITRI